MRTSRVCATAAWLGLVSIAHGASPDDARFFAIRVVDAATGRGVPLVELKTPHEIRYYTDSAGRVAVREPGLMGERVFFKVRSPGYRMPKNGWFRGFRVRLTPGGSKTVEIHRAQPAQRLYRVTGAGIYRDTVLLGKATPVEHPLLNAGVAGQDSVVNTIYRGKLYWFWGDTKRASFPLGNFQVTGAVSRLPGDGGLPPSKGVNLDYFADGEGFVRKMCPMEGSDPVWIRGLMVLSHEGEPTMVCHYAQMKSLGEKRRQGIAVWNDEKEVFEKRTEFPLDAPLHPFRNPIRVQVDGAEWFYFSCPYPVVRVRATLDHILDPKKYQAFTCLKPGARWDADDPPIERDASGDPVWGWKADTARLHGRPGRPFSEGTESSAEKPSTDAVARFRENYDRERFLRSKGKLSSDAGLVHLRSAKTGEPAIVQRASVYWNDYRKKWILIGNGLGPTSLGDVWYAEGDTLLGPWVYARRVATHGHYSFYNTKQHPYFDQDGGRTVYFEGTYSARFSTKNVRPTPRYNYNQLMYRLDLTDEALSLPSPVYEAEAHGATRYGTAADFEERVPAAGKVPFYALPPHRKREGTVVVRRVDTDGGTSLQVGEGKAEASGETVAFRALPRNAENADGSETVPLFEYRHRERGTRRYRPPARAPDGPYEQAKEALCRVWPSPRLDPPRHAAAVPSPREHAR